ncbi:MAG: type II toxin-antitoxin system RelE/ParE family toxin [Aeromicrobium sp.]|uniref:type II toxin-antitoxin system RelE/ParE family toxin n=1 Tax=Aeromicrobium sp. TaxID=1871063 RepID=UPI0039E3EB38
MNPEPRWHTEAIGDLDDGYQWHEERQPGLGSDLAAELDVLIKQAMASPLQQKQYEHPKLPAGWRVRKIQLRRFSEYGLIYTVVENTFWVVAVAHAKRRPGFWIDRMKAFVRQQP